jgi:hypothetical protein
MMSPLRAGDLLIRARLVQNNGAPTQAQALDAKLSANRTVNAADVAANSSGEDATSGK